MTSNYYNPADPNLIYLQSRAESDPALIEEYAEMMAAGAQFPACKAVGEQHSVYIYDGYHRGQAAQKASLPLLVSVKPGTRAEAEWHALAANQEHGLRRSNADKQKIVRLALAHEFGAKLSDRQLAAHCGVSDKTVGKIRAELVATAEIPQSTTRIGADGREIKVANIGSQPAEYVAIWQLEQALKAWMEHNYTYGLQTQIDALESIKQKTIIGLGMLETLTTKDILPGPRRKGDVVQACNNLLSQLQQKQWREGRAERIRAMTCICGQQTLFPVGDMDELTCSSCRRSWGSVHSFENTCRGCEKNLTTVMRVEGKQYCANCWDKQRPDETANRAWRCITQTAETCYLCGKEAIYHNNGWRDQPGADFHLCQKHYNRHYAAVLDHTDAAKLQAVLDDLKQKIEADPDTAPRGLACPHCGMAALQAADGSLKCINVDCNSWWENLIAYQAAVNGPQPTEPVPAEITGDASEYPQGYPKPLLCHRCGQGRVVKKPGDSGLICLGCNFKWNNLADFRSGQCHHLENNRPVHLNHLELKVKGFPKICPTGHAKPVNGGNCLGCEFHRQTDHGHWVCYHPAHQEPAETQGAERVILDPTGDLTNQALKLNSAYLLTMDKLEGLIEFEGKLYACYGGFDATAQGCKEANLVEVVEPELWAGPTKTYREACREAVFSYTGQKAKCKGVEWVLTDRELTLRWESEPGKGESENDAEAYPNTAEPAPFDFANSSTRNILEELRVLAHDGLPLDSPYVFTARTELRQRGWLLTHGNISPTWCLSHKNFGTIPGDDLETVIKAALVTWRIDGEHPTASPDSWSPPTPGLAGDLTYRHQRLCIRFAALVEKIKDVAWMDELDHRLAELEKEIAGDPAKISEATR